MSNQFWSFSNQFQIQTISESSNTLSGEETTATAVASGCANRRAHCARWSVVVVAKPFLRVMMQHRENPLQVGRSPAPFRLCQSKARRLQKSSTICWVKSKPNLRKIQIFFQNIKIKKKQKRLIFCFLEKTKFENDDSVGDDGSKQVAPPHQKRKIAKARKSGDGGGICWISIFKIFFRKGFLDLIFQLMEFLL